MIPAERRTEALERARDRVRRPALALAASGIAQVVLSIVGGVVPPLVIGGLVAWSGGGQDAWVAAGVTGGIAFVGVLISVVGGLIIAATGAAMIRLRNKELALAGVLLAFPIALGCGVVQMLLVPLVGWISGPVCGIAALAASAWALSALGDPLVDAAFSLSDGESSE